MPDIPTQRERIAVAVVTAFVCAVAVALILPGSRAFESDWDQVWYGSRAILEGQNPYSVLGPEWEVQFGFRLYYPLPALLAMLPLAFLPLALARALFVGLSAGLLAYAVLRDGRWGMWFLASGPFIVAVITAQWSPLLTATLLLPWLAPLVMAKPNIGLALTIATPERRFWFAGLAGGALLLIASFAIDSRWVGRWLEVLRDAPHFTPPVLLWGGPIILLALSRWRRPEARLLVALACVPHTTLTYEALPLLLVAKSRPQAILLAALSLVVMALQFAWDSRLPNIGPESGAAFAEWVRTVGTLSVALLYLPATIMVLRRPNEGPAPVWLTFFWRRHNSAVSQGIP